MDKERRRSGHRVDAIERNLKRRGDILVRLFTKADVAVADLQEAKVSSRQWLPGLCNLSKGLRYENAAADRPKQAGTGPCHALQKAAAINPVMLVIVKNVIGHNIWFLFGCLLFALHLSLLIGRDFIPEIFEGGCESQPRSTSVNNRISVPPHRLAPELSPICDDLRKANRLSVPLCEVKFEHRELACLDRNANAS